MKKTFPGMFCNIPWNVWRHSPECFTTFPRMFRDIPRNVLRNFPECFATFPGMFLRHSLEYNIPPIPRVPRISFPVPVFLFLYIAVLKHYYITKSIRELLIDNSKYLIHNWLNQLLYYTCLFVAEIVETFDLNN